MEQISVILDLISFQQQFSGFTPCRPVPMRTLLGFDGGAWEREWV